MYIYVYIYVYIYMYIYIYIYVKHALMCRYGPMSSRILCLSACGLRAPADYLSECLCGRVQRVFR